VNGFGFAEPQWVHAFWALFLFLGVLIYLERRGGDALERLVHPALWDRLVRAPARWRRTARIGLVGLCLGAVIFALMRPQWGLRYTSTRQASAEVMICLDVSRSMLAEDAVPNRLERAKAEIVDLLGYLQGDRVGLIGFAGRATVLSPMTPDFGFLRLVLDSVGPDSVTRGGTRLEEPIRKAVAGFDPRSDAARVIILITDGEDQDSFPIRAASEAREAGVRVIAIGYGSESGSPIYVTDPRTGARTMLRDADGEPVNSRLDGDTLRDIVRETEGVYVPAGTGVLDLESIYAEFLRGLLRGQSSERGIPVREEGYQWALLVALLALVASVTIVGPRPDSTGTGARVAIWLVALLWVGSGAATTGWAQVPSEAPAAGSASSGKQGPEEPTLDDPDGAGPAGGDADLAPLALDEVERTPREIYNEGWRDLGAAEFESAERSFRTARSEGAQDGELRFRATYNLGLAAARRAESLREAEPETALRLYYDAADRFRDGVRQRPDDAESRHNLEVVLRRAMLLADELAKRQEGGLEQQLERLIERQREVLGRLSRLLLARSPDPSYDADSEVQREYRAVAGDERVLLADADGLARQVAAERGAMDQGGAPAAPTPSAPAPTAEQLDAVLLHLDAARERMGRTRSQLRRRQGARAYRRGATALEELKRAQEALRDPVRVLSALTRDALQTSRWLGAWMLLDQQPTAANAQRPEWLSGGFLRDQQESLGGRSEELAARLKPSLLDESQASSAPSQWAEAAPLVTAAGRAFREGASVIEQDAEAAARLQASAIRSLLEAQERLLDLKRLIELVYQDERSLEQDLDPSGSGLSQSGLQESQLRVTPGEEEDSGATRLDPAQRAALRRGLQAKNVERTERMIGLLDLELQAMAQAPAAPGTGPPAAGAPPNPEQEVARERLERARPLAEAALEQMRAAATELERDVPSPVRAKAAVTRSLEPLSALRRIFFTIAELLRDTLERQVELGDETRDAAALSIPAQRSGRLAGLAERQTELRELSTQITSGLREQAEQSASAAADEPEAEQASEIFREAATHVEAGALAMEQALAGFAAQPFTLEAVEEPQATATRELAEALALLVPPEQQQQNQDSQDDSDDGSNSPQDSEDESKEQERSRGDAAQALQAVRDREAQRRREKAAKRQSGYETVERDW